MKNNTKILLKLLESNTTSYYIKQNMFNKENFLINIWDGICTLETLIFIYSIEPK